MRTALVCLGCVLFMGCSSNSGSGSDTASNGGGGSGGSSGASGSGGATGGKGGTTGGATGGKGGTTGGATGGKGGTTGGAGGKGGTTGGATGGSSGSAGKGGAGGAGDDISSSVAALNKSGAPASTVAKATKAKDVVAAWTLGWNLGNSLDANGCGAANSEGCWGNPVKEEQLAYVASLGFKVVRIPVTWAEHIGSGPNYTIDSTWMSRVETVVNYALKAGLCVIINVHHDGGDGGVSWINLVDASGQTTTANTEAVITKFTAVWKQIAAHFKDFDNRLVFESMNEIHHEYGAPEAAWYTMVNDLNQTFVTTVRDSGGNNTNRFLVVPGYNTNIDQTIEGFTLPKDSTADDHLILSYHYYDPYKFTITKETHTWGSDSPGSDDFGQEDSVNSQFDKMKTTFIDKGVPVIMGEFGAEFQEGYEDYRRYWTEYVTKAAHDRGITPLYWDNGSGLINRKQLKLDYPDLFNAMASAVTSSYTLDQVAKP